jgi:hypothetical protein
METARQETGRDVIMRRDRLFVKTIERATSWDRCERKEGSIR